MGTDAELKDWRPHLPHASLRDHIPCSIVCRCDAYTKTREPNAIIDDAIRVSFFSTQKKANRTSCHHHEHDQSIIVLLVLQLNKGNESESEVGGQMGEQVGGAPKFANVCCGRVYTKAQTIRNTTNSIY